MPIDPSNIRLGRLPHSPTRIAAARQHVMGATAPAPLILPRPGILAEPSLVQNNILPTCSIAGLINSLRIWAQLRGFDIQADEDKLLALYAAICGCANTVSAIAATNGLVLQDVLEYIRAHGFDYGGQAPAELDFAAIDPQNVAAVKEVIDAHGSVYVGMMLHEADVAAGTTEWAGLAASAGPVIGGHCDVPFRWRTADVFDTATWGEDLPMDQDFFSSRVEEVWRIDWKMAVAP